jgi:hypothetical protein
MAGENMSDHRAVKSITVGDLVIEPIDKTVVHVEQVGRGIVGLALKRPLSIIVRSPAGTFRFDLEDRDFTADGCAN